MISVFNTDHRTETLKAPMLREGQAMTIYKWKTHSPFTSIPYPVMIKTLCFGLGEVKEGKVKASGFTKDIPLPMLLSRPDPRIVLTWMKSLAP
jgi:hypothetical protein